MSLLGSAILTMCLKAEDKYSDACMHALDQAAIHSGINYSIDALEKETTQFADRLAKKQFGEKGVEYIAFSAYLAKLIVDKKIVYTLPRNKVADRIEIILKPDVSNLVFRWDF